MSLPVTIENDALSLDVWPQIGGKVSSVIDKADHAQLLFSYPAEIPAEHPQYDRPYANSWCAGWDECIPAIGPSRYAGFPYDGIAVPDHGELWGLPTTAVPTKNGITTVWHGLRFGYRLARKLYVEDASLTAEYTLFNLAPFDFRFVWCQHALLAMTGPVTPVTIDLGPSGDGPHAFRYSHDHANQKMDRPFDWPNLAADLDLSAPDRLPPGGGWKCFSVKPISAPAVLRYTRRCRSLTIEFDGDDCLTAYWGIWVNTGGWARYKHFTVAPTTGRFDQLDRATWDDSAARIGPLGRCSWSVRWTVGPA